MHSHYSLSLTLTTALPFQSWRAVCHTARFVVCFVCLVLFLSVWCALFVVLIRRTRDRHGRLPLAARHSADSGGYGAHDVATRNSLLHERVHRVLLDGLVELEALVP